MKIILKTIPPTINKYIGRNNIWGYNADKKRITNALIAETVGINPNYSKCNMIVTYFFPDNRRRDPSNYDKFLLDGLVETNIIQDDNYKVIKKYTTIGNVDSINPRVEIDIEEIKDSN